MWTQVADRLEHLGVRRVLPLVRPRCHRGRPPLDPLALAGALQQRGAHRLRGADKPLRPPRRVAEFELERKVHRVLAFGIGDVLLGDRTHGVTFSEGSEHAHRRVSLADAVSEFVVRPGVRIRHIVSSVQRCYPLTRGFPMPQPLVIFVDIDDTLVRSFGSKRIPMTSVIERVRALHADGAVLYAWSSGGAEYARTTACELGLSECFVDCLPKPDVFVDDVRVDAWRNTIQLHPNEVAHRTLEELRALTRQDRGSP